MQKNLSSVKAVQQEIKLLINKRNYLTLLLSLKNYKDCVMMLSASHEIEGRGFHFVRQEHFPFDMEKEFRMLFEDAISNLNSDIATLELHLKSL